MSDLVKRLSEGEHKVEMTRCKGSIQKLRDMLAREFILVKFTETQGGTELGFELDQERSQVDWEELEGQHGNLTLAGELIFDYVKTRCVVHIDVATMGGTGHLEILGEPAMAF